MFPLPTEAPTDSSRRAPGDRPPVSRGLLAWVAVCAAVLLGAGSEQRQVLFDRAFGLGVDTGAAAFENCTTASGCQAGTASGATGAMFLPTGVAVDAQGRILVADQINNRIARYVVAGDGTVTFDRAFGVGVDTGAAVFENCTTASGCQAGTASGAAGGMNEPVGVAVDAQGRILVADSLHNRISRYVVAGDGTVTFDRAFGINVDPGGGTGFENCTTASGCQAGTSGGAAGGMFLPAGVAVDAQGRILVADFGNFRIVRYVVAGDGTVTFDRAFGIGVATGGAGFENCTTDSGCQAGTPSGAAGGMESVIGVAVDAQGRILVSDQGNERVERFVSVGDAVPALSTWAQAALALTLLGFGARRMRRGRAAGRSNRARSIASPIAR
jgi:tripartite motif-containing protein 71